LAETDEQARRLRLLNELSEKLGQASNFMETYQQTVSTVIEVFKADHANIAIWTDSTKEELEIAALAGENTAIQVGQVFSPRDEIYQVPLKRSMVVVENEFNHPLYPQTQSIIAGPIFASGVTQGIILIGHRFANRFGESDRTFLTQIISILSAVLENRNLFDAIEKALATTEEQARRLAELNQLSELLGQAISFDQVLELSMDRIDRIIPSMVCQAVLFSETENLFTVYELTEGGVRVVDQRKDLEGTFLDVAFRKNRATSLVNVQTTNYQDLRQLTEKYNIDSVIAAPLIASDEVFGAILVGNHKDFAYSSQDETLMMSIASILASTLDNRQLFQQIQRRSIQLETSAEVSRIASTILDPDELLPEVVELIKTGFNLYYAGIFLIDHTGEVTGEPNAWAVLRAGSGEPGQQMLAAGHKLQVGGTSMIGTAISESEAQISHNVGAASRFFRNPYLPYTRSEMALPLISRGQVLGALTIQSERESAFSQEDITSLQTMTDQLANAIENARLFEQAEVRAEELTVLNEMARAYTQTLDIDRIIEASLEYTSRLMNADNYYLALFNSESRMIEFRIFVEEGQRIPPPEPRIYLGEGITDWIITNKIPVLMPSNVEDEMRAMGIEIRGRSAESWLGVPMLIGSNVLGVIAVQSYNPEVRYHNRELELLSAIASQTAVAIDNGLRFFQTRARAQYEQILREITTQVHTSTNAESILKTAVREVGNALGRQAFIQLTMDEDNEPSGIQKPSSPNHQAEPLSQPPADDQTNES
ncbi:MAG: GAF domain-containing protein, partial [Anaerolineales bacterium]